VRDDERSFGRGVVVQSQSPLYGVVLPSFRFAVWPSKLEL
jgi:hypothetical protein